MFVTMAVHAADRAGHEGDRWLLSLESYQDSTQDRLVAIGRWQSPEQTLAGVTKLGAIGGRNPEWTTKPDDLHRLVAVGSSPD